MALTTKRVDIPSLPGQWVEFKPVTPGVVRAVEQAGDVGQTAMSILILSKCLTAWSFDFPVSVESIEDEIELATFQWLLTELDLGSSVRPAPEKKDSGSDSSPGLVPAEAAGPTS